MSHLRIVTITLCLLSGALSGTWQARASEPSLVTEEQAAFTSAARVVSPAVVRIETIGGLETVGEMLIGSGPTTGLIVSADGYIISSSFNFVQRPSSILVTLPSGTRLPARLVATDHNRMLTLLQVETDEPLPVPEAVPQEQVRVGQWALALGRTYEGDLPTISVGIVSALRRIEGRALQTDAKISPANYGGPLIDLQGRVLGVLVPLAPGAGTEVAGVEWYDSGIGFAIPLTDINLVLPRLQSGEDLHPGKLGINLAQTTAFEQPIVGAVHPAAPAAKVGLQTGDRIVAAAGSPVRIRAELEAQLKPLYAGDTLELTVARGSDDEQHTFVVPLIGELQAYARPHLGILPVSSISSIEVAGVPVRFVYPVSPAALGGIQPADVITQLNAQQLETAAQLQELIAELSPGDDVTLTVLRGEELLTLTATLAEQLQQIVAELPPTGAPAEEVVEDGIVRGKLTLTIPERAETILAYVPSSYQPDVPHRVLVFLHGSQQPDEDSLIAMWQPYCDAHGVLLLAPQHLPEANWQATDIPLIERGLELLAEQYNVARGETVLHGFESGGELAAQFATREADSTRALAVVGAPLSGRFGPASPLERMDFYVAAAEGTEAAAALEKTVVRLREAQHPVAVRSLGETPRYLNDDELAELFRWIESLDRI